MTIDIVSNFFQAIGLFFGLVFGAVVLLYSVHRERPIRGLEGVLTCLLGGLVGAYLFGLLGSLAGAAVAAAYEIGKVRRSARDHELKHLLLGGLASDAEDKGGVRK